MPDGLDVLALAGVHVAHADERRVRAVDLGRGAAQVHQVGSPRPSATASGMPWMLPEGLVSGVFMSPWASNQMRPILLALLAVEPRRRRRSCPSRWSGRRPARPACGLLRARRRPGRAAPRRSRGSPSGTSAADRPGSCVSGMRDARRRPRPRPRSPARAGACSRPAAADRGRAHVDAAAAGAEVQGHADDGDAAVFHVDRYRGSLGRFVQHINKRACRLCYPPGRKSGGARCGSGSGDGR